MEKQRALPELNPSRHFWHLRAGQGGPSVGQEGWGGHRRVPTRPQPRAGMHTVSLVPEELRPPSRIPLGLSTMHHWPQLHWDRQ